MYHRVHCGYGAFEYRDEYFPQGASRLAGGTPLNSIFALSPSLSELTPRPRSAMELETPSWSSSSGGLVDDKAAAWNVLYDDAEKHFEDYDFEKAFRKAEQTANGMPSKSRSSSRRPDGRRSRASSMSSQRPDDLYAAPDNSGRLPPSSSGWPSGSYEAPGSSTGLPRGSSGWPDDRYPTPGSSTKLQPLSSARPSGSYASPGNSRGLPGGSSRRRDDRYPTPASSTGLQPLSSEQLADLPDITLFARSLNDLKSSTPLEAKAAEKHGKLLIIREQYEYWRTVEEEGQVALDLTQSRIDAVRALVAQGEHVPDWLKRDAAASVSAAKTTVRNMKTYQSMGDDAFILGVEKQHELDGLTNAIERLRHGIL